MTSTDKGGSCCAGVKNSCSTDKQLAPEKTATDKVAAEKDGGCCQTEKTTSGGC